MGNIIQILTVLRGNITFEILEGSYICVEGHSIFPKRVALRKNIVFRDKNITPPREIKCYMVPEGKSQYLLYYDDLYRYKSR